MNFSKEEKKNLFGSVRHLLHEVKTPLATVQLALRNLEARLQSHSNSSDDEAAEYLALMKQSLNQVDEKMRDLTIFSKSDALQFQPVSMENVINTVVKKYNYDVQIEKDSVHDLPLISADESALHLALRLIIKDAIRHGQREDALRIKLGSPGAYVTENVDMLEIIIKLKNSTVDNSLPVKDTKKEDEDISVVTARQILRAHGSDLIIDREYGHDVSMRFALKIFRD